MKLFKIISMLYIIFSSLFSIILTEFICKTEEDPIVISNKTFYFKKFENIPSTCFFQIFFQSEEKELNEVYLDFSTSPINELSQNLQQIIFSTTETEPTTNTSDLYSFKFSKNAKLITKVSNNTVYGFLALKCLQYPCSFNFKAELHTNGGNLSLTENNNYYFYRTNSLTKSDVLSTLNVSFPGNIKMTYPNNNKHRMSVSVINPQDLDGDYMILHYFMLDIQDKKIYPYEIREKLKKMNIGATFLFDEETFTQDNYEFLNYKLEIESIKNQFISIIVKNSSFDASNKLAYSEITPNSVGKFSVLDNSNECYKINEEYIKNYINNDNTHLLYASINFYSIAPKAYLKYSNEKINIDTSQKSYSINYIIEQKNNEYPLICFEQEKTNVMNSLMISLTHLYPSMKNIDIYDPVFSGFYNTKTLLPDSLAMYSHYSDIINLQKISFYLKPIKGKPEMYIVQCDDYPQCYNTFDELKNKENVYKAIVYKDFQFYQINYSSSTRDMSPEGPYQNLLYVYCPPSSNNEICQFEILIHSDLDEINLYRNSEFNFISKENENNLYKFSIKQGGAYTDKVEFCLNASNDDIYFDTMKYANNATITNYMNDNLNCYKYEIDMKYNDIETKDINIHFSIKALKDINYILNIKSFGINADEYDEILNFNSFKFPYDLNYIIKEEEIGDLLFNFNIKDINSKNFELNEIKIGFMIFNETFLAGMDEDNKKKIFDEFLIEYVDIGTKSAFVKIDKNTIENNIKDKGIKNYLHIVILYDNNIINNNIDIDMKANIFTSKKSTDSHYYLKNFNNIYMNDKLILEQENQNIYNLYNIEVKDYSVLQIKFSSNYEINDKFLLYFVKYNKDIDLKYLENNQLKYEKVTKEQDSTIELYLNTTTYDNITLAVVSKLKKDEMQISNINYAFKYKLYENFEIYNKSEKYEIITTYNLTEDNSQTIIKFDRIRNINPTITIRQINNDKLIQKENIETYAKLESENKLVEGNVQLESDKIVITLNNKEDINKYMYSIIIDDYNLNEKFVIAKKFTYDEQDEKKSPGENEDDSMVFKIVIPIVVVIGIVIIVIIIICVKRRKRNDILVDKDTFGKNGNLLEDRYNIDDD